MVTLYDVYQHPRWIIAVLVIFFLWELVWRGIALWYAARYNQKGWYVCVLIFNTVGILPIVYLLWFKPQWKENIKLDKLLLNRNNASKNVLKNRKKLNQKK